MHAPDKGSVTRKNISKKKNYYVESAKNDFNEFLDSLSRNVQKGIKDTSKKVEQETDNLKVK